ncbi:hypothetical protein [Streptomyces sp. NPDC002790]|uniref:hypothetical protein n=1 Tax=Streptomyces sp. NPDC002790 TaxID=3154431 RepID=UPI00332E547F
MALTTCASDTRSSTNSSRSAGCRKVPLSPPQAGSTAGDALIWHAHAELAATRAPYHIEVTQSRLDVVPDLTDPRWQQMLGDGGQDRVYLWKVTCNPRAKSIVTACGTIGSVPGGDEGGVAVVGR